MCINTLIILDDEKGKMREWFKSVRDASFNEGQMPSCVKSDNGYRYLFYIQDDTDQISFETKWAPPIEELIQMGKTFECSFELLYDEPGCGVYGELHYNHKTNTHVDIFLENEELELIIYDEDADIYTFESNEYESDSEPKDILLSRKIKLLQS